MDTIEILAVLAIGLIAGALLLLAFGFWLNAKRGAEHGANSIENMRETIVTKIHRGGQ